MIPIRRLLGQAIYHLHWSPRTFWLATPHEVYAAMEAGDTKPAEKDPFVASPEMQALIAAHTEKDKARA